jgi:hypothetical protein
MRETIRVHDGQTLQQLTSNGLDFFLGSFHLQIIFQRPVLEVLHRNVDVALILEPTVELNEQFLVLGTSQPREGQGRHDVTRTFVNSAMAFNSRL